MENNLNMFNREGRQSKMAIAYSQIRNRYGQKINFFHCNKFFSRITGVVRSFMHHAGCHSKVRKRWKDGKHWRMCEIRAELNSRPEEAKRGRSLSY